MKLWKCRWLKAAHREIYKHLYCGILLVKLNNRTIYTGILLQNCTGTLHQSMEMKYIILDHHAQMKTDGYGREKSSRYKVTHGILSVHGCGPMTPHDLLTRSTKTEQKIREMEL